MEFNSGLREIRSASDCSSYTDAEAASIPERQCQQEQKEAGYCAGKEKNSFYLMRLI